MLRFSTGFAVLILLMTSCQKKLITTDSGLEYRVVKKGRGEPVRLGDEVSSHCLLLLEDGTQIWSTKEIGDPFVFTYGEDRLIPGFDETISYMRVGETVEVKIPPELGYGSRGAGDDIPPNATLIFVIEILKAKQ